MMPQVLLRTTPLGRAVWRSACASRNKIPAMLMASLGGRSSLVPSAPCFLGDSSSPRRTFSSSQTRPTRPLTTASASSWIHPTTSPLLQQEEHNPATVPIPDYLQNVYWWAYILPSSIYLLDRQYLVNLVLWGNANTLRDAALQDLTRFGRTLQVACVYGSFTPSLVQHLERTSDSTTTEPTSLDVIDVVPDQLKSLQRKLKHSDHVPVTLTCNNAESLSFDDGVFDQAVFYLLLHEMPNDVRLNAIREACRVLKPGGKLVFIDFHRPMYAWRRWLISVWFLLEPFAKDLWSTEIVDWIPNNNTMDMTNVRKELYCGGLFQKVVVTKLE